MLLAFGPRIWEKDVECIDTVISNVFCQNFINVVVDNFQISHSERFSANNECANSWFVNFHCYVCSFRIVSGDL